MRNHWTNWNQTETTWNLTIATMVTFTIDAGNHVTWRQKLPIVKIIFNEEDMRVSDVFRPTKKIVQVDGRASLHVAIQLMREHNVGALLVRSDGTCSTRLLSERDVIDALAVRGSAVLQEYVDNAVPEGCISCRPDDPIHHAMHQMTQHRVRHLPVQDGGDVVGILSIGDIIKAQLDTMSLENRILREEVILKRVGKC